MTTLQEIIKVVNPYKTSTPTTLVRQSLIGIVMMLHLLSALNREISWDEFYFLSLVLDYERGTLTHSLQTFHVHLFWWLSKLPLDEISQILLARCLMWLLLAVTIFFLFKITRTFASPEGAFFATIVYSTLVFVLQHGTSFRSDPIITALLMGAAYAVTRGTGLLLLGTSTTAFILALLISIKSVFYIPLMGAVVAIQWLESSAPLRLLRDIILTTITAAFVFFGLFWWHASSILQATHEPSSMLRGALTKTILDSELFYGIAFLKYTLWTDIIQWVLVAIGIVIAVIGLTARDIKERFRAVVLLAFATPLLTVVFYRNAFPYYYVFMMAPVAVTAGISADWLVNRFRIAKLLPLIMVALAVSRAGIEFNRNHSAQRSVIAAVSEIFPNPVPYIDRCGMIAAYPMVGFFMSGWGMENYRQSGQSLFARSIYEKRPLFVIANHLGLLQALQMGASAPQGDSALTPDDAAALHDNFIPHWGPIWVAGKRLYPTSGATSSFAVAIPGEYTLEAGAHMLIDGQPVFPGSVLTLTEGVHRYRGPFALLRYGKHLPRPHRQPPNVVFTGF